MRVLWALGQGTVEEIRARLLPERPLAYTTVMTLMDRLARRGAVDRRKQGRAHLYTPAIAENEVRERALDRFIEDFFSGSRTQLRAHLGGEPFGKPNRPAKGPAALTVVQKPRHRRSIEAEPKRAGAAPLVIDIDTALL